VYQAVQPLLEIAELGIPVLVVPGNHERSRTPHERFAAHPNLHVFLGPDTATLRVRGASVAVAGLPYQRDRVRERFREVLSKTGWDREDADLRLLCMHHCVEGAVVGPGDHTFRSGPDVIRCADLPTAFAAVLSGHIHRGQVLLRDLDGRPLPAPVLYPGSLERTAFAEIGEEKGVLLLDFETGPDGGRLARYELLTLPVRPMLTLDLLPEAGPPGEWRVEVLRDRIAALVGEAPRDAVCRIRVHGIVPSGFRPLISASRLRALAPAEMNLEILLAEDGSRGARRARDRAGASGPRTVGTPDGAKAGTSSSQLSLALS
jgi:DNA repair exonuclease SbcCD nuclease subunit